MYEKLIEEAEEENLDVVEVNFNGNIKGLYSDNIIGIKTDLSNKDKICIIAEEIGHYHKTYGNILDQSNVLNRKQERQARIWAYEKLFGITDIIKAYEYGVKSRFELSEYLNITEEFIEEALSYYREKYGLLVSNDTYTVYFEPLAVMRVWG